MVTFPVRIYRTLTALFPRDFRADFAADMSQAFADACHFARDRRGIGGVLHIAFRGFIDLANRLPREWHDHLRPSRRPQRRERRKTLMLETLGQNLRYAVRSLIKNPGFATIVTLTLALGIGASTAIFSVVHGVLLTPLPFPDPERVITVGEVNPTIDIEPRIRLNVVTTATEVLGREGLTSSLEVGAGDGSMGESPLAEIGHPKKRAFLAAYAQTGNKSLAAEMAGIVKQTIYTRQWREDPEFQGALASVDLNRTVASTQLLRGS